MFPNVPWQRVVYYGLDRIDAEESPPILRQIANRMVFYPVKKPSKTQFLFVFKYVIDRNLLIIYRNVVEYTNRKSFWKIFVRVLIVCINKSTDNFRYRLFTSFVSFH